MNCDTKILNARHVDEQQYKWSVYVNDSILPIGNYAVEKGGKGILNISTNILARNCSDYLVSCDIFLEYTG
jgi:hypothetical protein